MKFCIVAFLCLAALATGKSIFPVYYAAPGLVPTLFTTNVNPGAYFGTHTFVLQVVPKVKGQEHTDTHALLKSAGGTHHDPTGQFVPPAFVNVPVSSLSAVLPTQHSFHSQDGHGAYSFGYYGGPDSRAEYRDHSGNVVGAYNYIDATGKLQSAQYTAGKHGFNIAATNIPVAPQETPEVQKARAEFEKAFKAEKSKKRTRRAADPAFVYSTNTYNVPVSYATQHVIPTYPATSVVLTPVTYTAVKHVETPVSKTAVKHVATPVSKNAVEHVAAPIILYSATGLPVTLSNNVFPIPHAYTPFFKTTTQFKAGTAKLETHPTHNVVSYQFQH